LLSDDARQAVLRRTREVLGNAPFVAGAFVADQPGVPFSRDAHLRQIEPIHQAGATPVIFQSFGLTGLADDDLIAAYEPLAHRPRLPPSEARPPPLRPLHRLRTEHPVRPLWPNLLPGGLPPAPGHPGLHRRQALLPATRTGMATPGPARPGPA